MLRRGKNPARERVLVWDEEAVFKTLESVSSPRRLLFPLFCAGRLRWALTTAGAERQAFDRVVEEVGAYIDTGELDEEGIEQAGLACGRLSGEGDAELAVRLALESASYCAELAGRWSGGALLNACRPHLDLVVELAGTQLVRELELPPVARVDDFQEFVESTPGFRGELTLRRRCLDIVAAADVSNSEARGGVTELVEETPIPETFNR